MNAICFEACNIKNASECHFEEYANNIEYGTKKLCEFYLSGLSTKEYA